MRGLTASLAAIALSATGAMAQQEGGGSSDRPTSAKVVETAKGQLFRGQEFEGGTLYVTGDAENEGWTASTVYEEVGESWSEAGRIADLVISQDSAYAGIVAETGDRRIFLSIQDIAIVLDDGTVAYVTKLSESELSDLPEVTEDTWQ